MEMSTGDTFDIRLEFDTDDGYYFTDSPNCCVSNVNGETVNAMGIAAPSTNTHYVFMFTYTVPEGKTKTHIDTVKKAVIEPVAGEMPEDADTYWYRDGIGYSAYEDGTSVVSTVWEPNDSTFESGKTYTVTITIAPDDSENYYIDKNTDIYINDKLPDFVIDDSGNAVVTLSYSLTEAIVEPDFVYGDANANGGLQAADAAHVLQKVLNGNFKMPIEEKTTDWLGVVDVNASGNLSAEDSAMILQKVLNNGFTMPAEKQ